MLELFGAEELEHLLPVDGKFAGVYVYGYVSEPSWTRSDRNAQYVFVNNRPATAPIIQNAIRESYPKQDEGRRPIVYLFIDVPAEDWINVHPTSVKCGFERCRT